MERRQVEYFLAIAAHGSFTGAAVSLRVAQPSLSSAIKSLERELGALLFDRLGRGVRLTSAGEALVAPAQQILREFATARASVQDVAGLRAGRLDLVALTTLAVDPLARLAGLFRQEHPEVALHVEDPGPTDGVAEVVASGRCELGLTDVSLPVRGLRGLELPDQELLAVLPPTSDIAVGASLTWQQVAELPIVTTPPGTSPRVVLEAALSAAGLPLVVAVETAHRAAIVPLVLAGAGASLLPRSMAEDAARQGARTARLDPPLRRGVRLLWRSGPLSPAAAAFLELVTRDTAPPPPEIPALVCSYRRGSGRTASL